METGRFANEVAEVIATKHGLRRPVGPATQCRREFQWTEVQSVAT